MRIALLTDASLQSAYLVSAVAQKYDNCIWVVERSSRANKWRTVLRRRKKIGWSGVIGIILLRLYSRLFETHPPVLPHFSRNDIEPLDVESINDPGVLEVVNADSCDVCVVFGTTIIRKAALSRMPQRTINLHGGIMPEYRGSNCCIWAVLNGEPHRAGITWHLVDSGVDTGTILKQAPMPLQQKDTSVSIFHRQALIGLPLLMEILAAWDSGHSIEPVETRQSNTSRLYFTPPLWTYLRFKRKLRGIAGVEAMPIPPP